jgi:hypothetical protein
MRNCARIYIPVTQGLNLAIGIVLVLYSIAVTQGNLFVCGAHPASMAVPAVVFFRFFLNKPSFR